METILSLKGMASSSSVSVKTLCNRLCLKWHPWENPLEIRSELYPMMIGE